MAIVVRIGLLCALVAWGGDAPPKSPPAPVKAHVPAKMVKLDVVAYSVSLDVKNAERLDPAEFRRHAESRETLEKAMQNAGTVQQIALIDRTVNIMEDVILASGASVPIPQASAKSQGGTLQTTVTYQDCGVILELTETRDAEGDGFTAQVEVEVSSLKNSTIKISSDIHAPVFWNYKEKSSMRFIFDKPMVNVLIANPDGGDEITAIVVRYSFSKADQ